jgi:hypothetical protein
MKSILERSFKYRPSCNTDLRKTFAKVRREQRLNALTILLKKMEASAPAMESTSQQNAAPDRAQSAAQKVSCVG